MTVCLLLFQFGFLLFHIYFICLFFIFNLYLFLSVALCVCFFILIWVSLTFNWLEEHIYIHYTYCSIRAYFCHLSLESLFTVFSFCFFGSSFLLSIRSVDFKVIHFLLFLWTAFNHSLVGLNQG